MLLKEAIKDLEQFKDISKEVRLYYKPFEKYEGLDTGFEFVVVQWVSSSIDNYFSNVWECKEVIVEKMFFGKAYFDGIRHLYMGQEELNELDGYIYYPNTKTIQEAFKELQNLEKTFCSEQDLYY